MEAVNVNLFHLVFLVCIFCSTTASKCVDLYTVGEKDKYFPGEIMEIIHTIGFQQCQKICGKKIDCLSINYNKDQLKCELISTPVSAVDVEMRAGFIFAKKKMPDMCTKMNCSDASQCFQTKVGNSVCITAPSTTPPPSTTSLPSTTSAPLTTTLTSTTSQPSTTTLPSTTSAPITTSLPTTTSPPATTSSPLNTSPPSSCALDCQDISDSDLSAADTHNICPFGDNNPVEVKCKVIGSETWTIIQRRFDGSVDFYRYWDDYKKGFGNAATEYWIGNDVISILTSTMQYKLLIELESPQGATVTVNYNQFSVGDETTHYKLSMSGFSGAAAGDAMINDRGYRFSARDNYDPRSLENCAILHQSGWWHPKDCYTEANLNGQHGNINQREKNMFWYTWLHNTKSLKSCSMMIRRR